MGKRERERGNQRERMIKQIRQTLTFEVRGFFLILFWGIGPL